MYRKLLASRVFERQVALISGGCSGVGRTLATRLAQAGAPLALLDLDPSALEGLVEHLVDHHNAEVLGLPCDVTDAQAVERAVALLGERFGGIDLLVCCAAVGHRGAVLDCDPEAFRQVMAVNFFGALHCARAALPSLLARRGQIVAFGAPPAFSPPRPGHGAEVASRQALHGLFETLRREIAADGVNVMLVCPGTVAGDPDGEVPSDDDTPSAQEIAEAIFQGALRRRHLLVPSGAGWRTRLLARLAP
ncbi:Short-chain dehydrogenase [Azotobacter beijerinckii]|uniref:Short-chain dehydrogenase n=1 Tax=Azotobacter beijerinckii TaxID=170623 RepID=A0A1H6TZ70_9GAMM|nr:SDR family oxidoreductase [Azotobacter beijerinckii]SEI81032.1 Short-chain dehydrogenase [Azotobacter beijerinckii]SEQ44686.1 Short-chain dehydrogenase [Azotobacter beijerinckii]